MRIRAIDRDAIHDRFGVDHPAGEVFEIRDDIALKYIRLGRAVPAPEPVIETAAVAPPANTAKRTGRAKPRRKA